MSVDVGETRAARLTAVRSRVESLAFDPTQPRGPGGMWSPGGQAPAAQPPASKPLASKQAPKKSPAKSPAKKVATPPAGGPPGDPVLKKLDRIIAVAQRVKRDQLARAQAAHDRAVTRAQKLPEPARKAAITSADTKLARATKTANARWNVASTRDMTRRLRRIVDLKKQRKK